MNRITLRRVAEVPASTAPTMKMPKPMTYIRLRPSMSDRRPMGRRSEPVVRMYPSATPLDGRDGSIEVVGYAGQGQIDSGLVSD